MCISASPIGAYIEIGVAAHAFPILYRHPIDTEGRGDFEKKSTNNLNNGIGEAQYIPNKGAGPPLFKLFVLLFSNFHPPLENCTESGKHA